MNWRFWNMQEPQRPVHPEPTPPCPKPPARVLKVEPPRPWPLRSGLATKLDTPVSASASWGNRPCNVFEQPRVQEFNGVPIYLAGVKVRATEPFIEIPPVGPINGEHLAVIRSQPTLGDAGARVQLWVYMDGELNPGSAYVRDIKRMTE